LVSYIDGKARTQGVRQYDAEEDFEFKKEDITRVARKLHGRGLHGLHSLPAN
jgi:hypothetical protein